MHGRSLYLLWPLVIFTDSLLATVVGEGNHGVNDVIANILPQCGYDLPLVGDDVMVNLPT